MILQPGARLKWENGADAWLSAKTHAEADASMGKVANMVQSQALPFFEATKSVDRLREYLIRENWGLRYHLHLEIAFCEARSGRVAEAQNHAIQAIELFREDGRTWCSEYIDLCQQLLSGIEGDKLADKMQRWIDHSVCKLGLSKIRQ